MKKLGFGCMRLPVLGESKDFMSAEDIDLAQFCQMVDRFMERGFTYFDTSYVYHNGKSEVFLKEALVKRYPRESFLLADKLPAFSITRPEQVPVIFEEQLERCGVSYFDYYLLHNIWETNYDTNIVPCDEFGFACRMKKEGKIRHLGMSFHDSPEALDRILTEHPEVEFVQIALNYYDWDSELVQSRRCYAGCDSKTVNSCMDYAKKGEWNVLPSLLKQHRKILLERLHTDQQQIDCLDFLLYRIKKENSGGV